MWLALVAAAANVQAVAAPVVGANQPRPSYPSAHDATTVARWIRNNTSLSLADVVVLGKPFLFAATVRARSALDSDILVDLDVHEEVLDQAFASKMHARSAKLDVTVRCQDQHILTNAVTFYSGANLTGSADQTHPHAGWVDAPPGDFAAELVASACDPGYRRPFATLVRTQGAHLSKSTSPPKAIAATNLEPSLKATSENGLDQNDRAASKMGSVSASKPAPSKPPIYSVILGAYSTLQRAESALDASSAALAKYDATNERVIVESEGHNTLFLAYAGDWRDVEMANFVCTNAKKMNLDCEVHSR